MKYDKTRGDNHAEQVNYYFIDRTDADFAAASPLPEPDRKEKHEGTKHHSHRQPELEVLIDTRLCGTEADEGRINHGACEHGKSALSRIILAERYEFLWSSNRYCSVLTCHATICRLHPWRPGRGPNICSFNSFEFERHTEKENKGATSSREVGIPYMGRGATRGL